MKNIVLLLSFVFAIGSTTAQIVTIPDANFKAKLLTANTTNTIAKNIAGNYFKIDANFDGQIQASEAAQVSYLNVFQSNIASLTGILSFTSLQYLDCGNNQLTSINVIGLNNLKNFTCNNNLLTSLNVVGLNSLQSLNCSSNSISSLNLTGSSFINLKNLQCGFNNLTTLNLASLTNLQSLYCNNNKIATLNFTGLTNLFSIACNNNYNSTTSTIINLIGLGALTNLQSLNCAYNQLPSLTLTGLSSLQFLICDNNQLPTLTLTGLNSLTSIVCHHNLLTALNVSAFANLNDVDCSNNAITNLNVTGSNNLTALTCNNNSLSALNVTGLSNLITLNAATNQLITLNATPLTSLQTLNVSHNLLTSLLIKNGKNETNLDFSANSTLEYVCCDEDQIAAIQSKITTYAYTTCHANSYCTFVPGGTVYEIKGHNTFDNDNNGCSATDALYPNLSFTFSDGTNSGNLITDATGNYSYSVQAGTHTITPILANPTYYTVTPTSANVTFPATASPFVKDFCIVANGIHNDLQITIIPIGVARPGFDASYKIIYKNVGTSAQSGTINFVYDDATLDFVSANPTFSTQALNNLNWLFTNLLPFETREILVSFNLNSPTETPALNTGSVLNFIPTISSTLTEATPTNNTFTFNQTLVNSFDPNDKTCLEGTTITPEKAGDFVSYIIRFENTGTFPAQNVVVKDEIDTTKFDISTLAPVTGSHAFTTRITDTNKVEFIFENINLPFAAGTNDGYIAFKIKTKSTLALGNTFSNSAKIYFDYNFPIQTNTATTTIAALATQDFEFANYITMFPNPTNNVLNIIAKQDLTISSISIYNVLGQVVQTITKPSNSIDVSELKTGNYFVKIISDKGTSNSRFVKE